MPSKLSNLIRALRWSDFGTPRPSQDPPPGVPTTGAQTRATYQRSINVEHVPQSNPPQFRLKDDVAITIILQPNQMFVNDWVFRQPQAFQDSLLHHEQGHYDLVALFCRDMFIEIMAVKAQTFGVGGAVLNAVTPIFQRFDGPIAAVHALYDNDAQHGRNAPQQQRWDNIIQRAFTTPRNPPMQAPDGTAYKIPLLDCLRSNGVAI